MQILNYPFYDLSFRASARNRIVLLLLFLVFKSHSQDTVSELLNIHNSNSVPYISVQELAMPKTNAVVLDARELREYKTSHIKEAIYVGFDDFNLEASMQQLKNKDEYIVVYCSIGIRSEDIAEQLKKVGYTNVKNLYGGIFEWKNNDLPVYNMNEKVTDSVHTFSKEWCKWLKKGIKVYD